MNPHRANRAKQGQMRLNKAKQGQMEAKGAKRCLTGPNGITGAKWGQMGQNGDKRWQLGQQLFKDGDCPREGDHHMDSDPTFFEMVSILQLVCAFMHRSS